MNIKMPERCRECGGTLAWDWPSKLCENCSNHLTDP